MPAPASIPTILVVDDDVGLLVLIEGALRAEKCNVATVGSGADALAWLRNNAADLLLLDLKLHDMEGRKFIGAMAEAGRSVPFIVITGQGDERVAVDMMKRGALDYLIKDVNFIEFIPGVISRTLTRLADAKRLLEAEKATAESRSLTQAVLNSMTVQIAVVDRQGDIIAVNESWNRFAQENGESSWQRTGVGASYFEVCRRAEASGELGAMALLSGIQAVLGGSKASYSGEYPCHSPDQNRWFVVSVTPLARDGGGVVVSHTNITDRKRLEREVLEISEREQRKFGQDLHDGLGQRLTALEMFSHALAENLKTRDAGLTRQARKLNRELRETVTQARLISHSLAPIPLDGDGLVHGLSELAASTSRIPGVKCQFHCDNPVSIHDVTKATHLYRIAQESVNNALKHGRAGKIEIALKESAEGVELSVENNGRPIPATKPANGGMGLNAMRYRSEMIGASLSIESSKRKNVRVTCTLRRKA